MTCATEPAVDKVLGRRVSGAGMMGTVMFWLISCREVNNVQSSMFEYSAESSHACVVPQAVSTLPCS